MVFQAYYVADMGQIRDKLTIDFIKANRSSSLVAIIFANARKPFVRGDILPLIPYWNYRSKYYVTFFFPGYVKDKAIDGYTPSDPDTSFHEQEFTNTIDEFERESNWQYRGDTPIVLCRAYLQVHNDTNEAKAILDLSSMIEFELERALRDSVIGSIDSFFEVVIKAAKDTHGDDVQWKLSDQLGARALCDALVEAIISQLPAGTERVMNSVRFFRIKQQGH